LSGSGERRAGALRSWKGVESMPPANPFHRLVDTLAVAAHGGVRLRLRRGPGGLAPSFTGRVQLPPSAALLALVEELGVDRPGTIDLAPRPSGAWLVRTRGPLASRALEQRLRNALADWSPPPPGGGGRGRQAARGG
jgi:hypothetical protein